MVACIWNAMTEVQLVRGPEGQGAGVAQPRPVRAGSKSSDLSAVGAALCMLFFANPRHAHEPFLLGTYCPRCLRSEDKKTRIPPEFEKRLYSFIASVAQGSERPLLAAGGMPDHTRYLLFLLPATISLASAINMFKTNSSRFLHERGLIFQWQNGYGALGVSCRVRHSHRLHSQSAGPPRR